MAVAVGVSDMWHVTSDMQHMKCEKRHVTHDTWHLTLKYRYIYIYLEGENEIEKRWGGDEEEKMQTKKIQAILSLNTHHRPPMAWYTCPLKAGHADMSSLISHVVKLHHVARCIYKHLFRLA